MKEAFEEHEKNFLNPEKVKRDHAAEMKRLGVSEPGTDGKTFDDLMEEKMRRTGRSWKNPKRRSVNEEEQKKTAVYNKDIMDGIVVYVARKLQSVQDEVNAIVASLGGEYRYQYGPEVTHVIFSSGRANDTTKEFKQAKKDRKKIVCPDWVYMSRDEGRCVEEDAFPHTFNPRRSLSISISGGGSPNTRKANTRKNATIVNNDESQFDLKANTTKTKAKIPRKKPTMQGEELSAMSRNVEEEKPKKAAADRKKKEEEDHEERMEEEEVTKDMAKMEELMSNASSASGLKRRSLRLTLTSTEATPDKSANASATTLRGNDGKEAQPQTSAANANSSHPSQTPAGDSQVIQWKDPKEEAERKILQEKLAAESQSMAAQGGEVGKQ